MNRKPRAGPLASGSADARPKAGPLASGSADARPRAGPLASGSTGARPRAGLLPLYLELYDERLPEMRGTLVPFLSDVADRLSGEGIEVVAAPVCRLRPEFEDAIGRFEAEDVDCIVTLHLAYSPSLESVDALGGTRLPIVILDSTMDLDFGPGTHPGRILYNHGIHGVQDMASVLRRRGKPFALAAGHVSESDVIPRAAAMVRAAYAARLLGGTQALRIGEPFAGMGDFNVPEEIMRKALGIEVERAGLGELAAAASGTTDREIDEEMALDRERFEVAADEDCHRRSVRVGLALRRLLDEGGYGAFSMNFLAFDSDTEPIDTVPFLEASKAMAHGVGYAGEGDALTAALVGALGRAFGQTTFTEIFCPDWKGGSLFLSHMGEVNPELAAGRPLVCRRPFRYTPARDPAVLTCRLRPGPAVLVNLAPGPADTFDLLVAPVVALDVALDSEAPGGEEHPAMRERVRGWIRPERALPEFLEEYSRRGGTHHSALVTGELAEALETFAMFAGLGCHRL